MAKPSRVDRTASGAAPPQGPGAPNRVPAALASSKLLRWLLLAMAVMMGVLIAVAAGVALGIVPFP